jgi:hypothetical protein
MNLHTLLANAFNSARPDNPSTGIPRQMRHRDRSMRWVEALAAAFRHHYVAEPDVCVFSKYHDARRAEFGMNEVLYDVCACRVDMCDSPRHGARLTYVKEALWQIESEFSTSMRQSLFDFNKLVLGAAKNKLFVGPRWSDAEACLKTLMPAARCCIGKVFMASVPHPDSWDTVEQPQITLWQLVGGLWQMQKG